VSISNAQFTAWLAADNKERVLLVEADAYSGGSVVTRYFSNRGFVSAPADTPASTAYDDIVTAVPNIRSAMAEVFRGRSLVSFGDIEIDNSGGSRDGWLLDGWDGRPVKMYLGDASWPKSDFRLVFSGATEDISASGNNALVLRVRDRQHLLDVPLQTNRVGGTGSTKDQRLPVCYGEVKNVEPVLVDAATRKYQVHDGSIQSIDAVYQDGAAIATYTASLGTGTFTLSAALTGRLTCDIKGSNAGSYVNKTADVMQRLITDRTSLTVSDIDTASVDQLNTDAPGTVGIYVTDDTATALTALDTLATGAGAYFCIGRDGKVTMGLFKAPSGTAVVSLTDDDVELAQVELTRRIVPLKSVRVGYARFYVTIDSGAASSLTEAQRQRLRDEYLVAYAATGATGFLLAIDDDLAGTCYVNSSDAATEATRRATLWGSLRRVFRVRGFMAAQQVKLGDVVSLDFARYGLTGGVLARVIGIRESVTSNSVELEVFL
jgi:hypothetical protein